MHDFGFFQFDPKAVKFLELHEIPLAPEDAKIGVEIRVVGNDAGEKLSILPGILAKLDRDAPRYGSNEYNDFNTFYYAAASSTSGGSSGSPVLNIEGRAVALNAGGAKKAASSFYLPLDRAVRALRLMQEGKPVMRGTLQTIFRHSAFDEVRRLGLRPETEAIVRQKFPNETGMLVIDQIVPSSCAHDMLHPGDVLVRFNGAPQTKFIPIEEFLDENVAKPVEIEVERGGVSHSFTFTVQNLHEISPSRFLEVSGAVLHSLSYQQARNASLPVGGVYLAQTGHMLLKAGVTHQCIITAVGNEPTPTLDDFIDVLAKLPNGSRTSLRYFLTRDRHRVRTAVITMDRQWFPMQVYERNDKDGLWHATRCPEPLPPKPPVIPETPPTPLTFHGNEKIKNVLQALVLVSFDIPYMIDGISSSSYTGAGVILDRTKGLVLVDRNTVPIALGDVLVTVAASIEIPGEVLFVHPIHNYSIIQYDPVLLGETPVQDISFSDEPATVGMALDFIGLAHNFTVVTQRPVVTKMDRLILREFQPPRYRATNVEVIHFDRVTKSVGGVFVGEDGKVVCLWLSFSYQDDVGRKEVFRGLSVNVVRDIVTQLKNGENPCVKVLPVQLLTYPLSKARSGMGLPDHWAQKLELCHHDRRQVLAVKRCTANTDASEKLENGDILLSIDDKVISKDFEVEEACRDKEGALQMIVFRNGEEKRLSVETTNLSTIGTERVIIWSGMVIQSPHYSVVSVGYNPEGGGVYCSRWCYGSPAHKYGLRATIWIVEVNGEPTATLDDFLKVVGKLESGEFVRLKTRDLSTKVKVFTLKTDYHYWPSVEVRRIDRKWRMISR